MSDFFAEMPIAIDTDVKGKTALIATMDCLCNLKCFGCHYYASRETEKKISFDNGIKSIISYLKAGVADCIVLTGGEVLQSSNMTFVLDAIKQIKQNVNDIEIIINTNGQFPDNVQSLLVLYKDITFHIDVKTPSIELPLNEIIIGRPGYFRFYIRNLLRTLDIVYNTDNNNHVLRTVDYPIQKICQTELNLNYQDYMKNGEFLNLYTKSIYEFVQSLNSKYNKNLSWFLNDFYDIK